MGLFTTLVTSRTGEIQWHQGDDDICGYVGVGARVGCPDGLYRGDGSCDYLVPVKDGVVRMPIPLVSHDDYSPNDTSLMEIQINAICDLTGLGYI